MKKGLSLLALVGMLTSVVSAATTLDLNYVFDQQRDFGYTENQNIRVEGFQWSDETLTTNLLIKTPILKDSKDVAVGEYFVLLGDKPISNYVYDQAARETLMELPVYTTMDLEGEVDIEISEGSVDPNQTYYGVVVPQDDNVIPGSYSQQFCFVFGTQEYHLGDECNTFNVPVEVAYNEPADPAMEQNVEINVENQDDPLHSAADGADMRMANISHTVQGNTITLTWTPLEKSENVEIKLFNETSKDYETLATVPMSQGKYEYKYDEKTQEFLFAFIPRDTKGTEVRYDVNVRHEAEVTPEIKTVPETGPVENMLVIVAITVALYAGYRALAGRKA